MEVFGGGAVIERPPYPDDALKSQPRSPPPIAHNSVSIQGLEGMNRLPRSHSLGRPLSFTLCLKLNCLARLWRGRLQSRPAALACVSTRQERGFPGRAEAAEV